LGFLIGVAVFVAASAACAAASSLPMVIAFRVVQAAGAALLTPTSLGLILASFPPERRQSAVRAWTAVGGLAAALGPAVGGVLVAASWRWVFLVNLPIGLAALIAGRRLLPRVPGHPGAQDVWRWSALTTGFSLVPGPIMVPLCSFLLAGRLIARFGPVWSSPPPRPSIPGAWCGWRWPSACARTTSATCSAACC
jgi:MFS family permease